MYTVHWKRSASNRLIELWTDAEDRAAVTAAVDEIDRQLALNPQEVGDSRSEETRIYFAPPVGVFSDVDEPTRTVQVLRVWTF